MFKTMMIALLAGAGLSQALPAFPGAEGYGSETPGGRGGQVIAVTTLDSTGPGSLYEALRTAGPRIIVFRVSGIINIQPSSIDAWRFHNADWAFLTVAGQTSPAGVTIIASGSRTALDQYQSNLTHDFVWRHIRFRAQGNNAHAINLYLSNHFVLDHCDFSGGMDECMGTSRCSDFSIQWCINANSPAGGQNYGWLMAYNPMYNISYHHSILANHGGRCGPVAHTNSQVPVNKGMVDYRNNLCYNSGRMGMFCLGTVDTFNVNVVGCTFKSGPSTDEADISTIATGIRPMQLDSHVHVYQDNNRRMYYKFPDTILTNDMCDRRYNRAPVDINTPFAMASVTTHTPEEAYDLLLAKAGSFPRDSMAARTIRQIRTNTGELRNVGDSLTRTGPTPPADADLDGMPDFWETAMGFNPNDSADQRADHDADGYTNIEEYLNDLALARICSDYHNAVYPIPENWTDYNPACCRSLISVENSKAAVPQSGLRAGLAVNGQVRFHLAHPEGFLEIVNLAGKRMARIPASSEILWRCADRNGERVAPGLYLVRQVRAGNLIAAAKLVVGR